MHRNAFGSCGLPGPAVGASALLQIPGHSKRGGDGKEKGRDKKGKGRKGRERKKKEEREGVYN